MGIKFYKTFNKAFVWKFEAQEFRDQLKKKAKKAKLRLEVKILP